MPNLYVVATPIGNREDITLRALRVLREVALVAAEDTRKTRQLLRHYQIETPLTSYFEHNKLTKQEYIMDCLSRGDVALVSSAGMPGISDPGYELIRAARERGITVVPVPGPSAVITAAAVSGLAPEQFKYIGFLPRKSSDRRRFLSALETETAALVMLEAPHRLVAALGDILLILGDREIAVCRELTKIYEEIFRGTVRQATARFSEPRGEFTLVIQGASADRLPDLTDWTARLRDMKEHNMTARDAVAQVAAASGRSKKELYRIWVGLPER
jgi:16S rRNA (cytidine1402-2'-O)-methyltransferase